ncbi:MAG: hypothetical protein RBR02_11225, partial [Desulfuromonadaceae bacterium]|nr:hypothetical protein [Desulfuromonadaceae bacterium]
NVVTAANTQAEIDAAAGAINAAIDALKSVDLTAYNAAVAQAEAVVEADYTAASYAALQTALTDNVVTEANTQAEVDAATAAITAAYDALELIPKVEAVAAVKAGTLGVTFNRELTEAEKAAVTFVVKKDGVNIVMSSDVAWNGTVAQLTKSDATKLAAGEYTVTASGIDFAVNSASGTIAAEKVASLEIVGTDLIKASTTTATVNYKVFNQYSEDITTTTATSALTPTSSLGGAVANVVTLADGETKVGKITVTKAGGATWATTDTTGVVTLTHGATGTTTTATLTLQAEAKVSTFAFTGFELPVTTPATTRIYTGSTNAATLTFTSANQYGAEASTYGDIHGNVTFVPSDGSVTLTETDVDGGTTATKTFLLTVDTSALATAKTVTITAIVNATGATSKIDLEVVKPSAPDAVTLDAPTAVVADNDAANTLVMNLGVTDQFGTALTAQQIVDAGGFTISSSNTAVINNAHLAIAATGANKGKIVNTDVIAGEGTAVITVTVNATGKSASQTVTVEEAAHVNTLQQIGTPASQLIQGATTKLGFEYFDQYGRAITTPVASDDYYVVLSEVKVSGDTPILTTSPAKGTIADETTIAGANAISVTAAANKTGTAKLRVQLVQTAGDETISQVDTSFTVVDNSGTGLTYAISAIPTLPGNANGTVLGSDTHAYPVVVTATDGSGNSYAIPADKIFALQSSDVAIVKPSDERLGNVDIDRQDNNWVVAGQNISAGDTATDSATITAFVNTDSGVKTATAEVTVAKAAPKTVEVAVVDTAITAGNPYAYAADTTELSTFEFDDATDAATGTAAFAYAKDQYGVYSAIDLTNATSFVNVDTDKYANVSDGQGFEINACNFELVGTDAQYRIDTAFKLLVNDGTDATVYKQLTVTVADGTLPTVATPGDGTIAQSTDEDVIFSKDLSAATQAAIQTAVENAAGGAGVLTVTWSDDKTMKLAASAAGSVTWAADLTADITDKAGNTTEDAVIIEVP